jgi:hypothetical protein
MNLSLTLACDHYDFMWPLLAAHIKPRGVDLQILTMGDERHDRMMQHGEFDACEIGLAPYFIAHENRNPVTAIPRFCAVCSCTVLSSYTLHRKFPPLKK